MIFPIYLHQTYFALHKTISFYHVRRFSLFWLVNCERLARSIFFSFDEEFTTKNHDSLNVYNTKKSRENIGSAALFLMSDRHKLRHASHFRTPVGYPLRYRESLKRFEKFLLPKRGGSFLEGFPTLLKNFRCLPVFRFF